MACLEKKSLPKCKNCSCARYVQVSEVQGLSFKDNNCHVFLDRSTKNYYFGFSKIFRIIQKFTLLLPRTTFWCELNRIREYICILVLWYCQWYYFCKTWLYCCDCCIVHRILVYFVTTVQELLLIINSSRFLWYSVIFLELATKRISVLHTLCPPYHFIQA